MYFITTIEFLTELTLIEIFKNLQAKNYMFCLF